MKSLITMADVGLTMLRPSKIPASLLLDAHPKMSPLLQPSQSTGAIPSSGSILQVINKRTAIVCWENELANNQCIYPYINYQFLSFSFSFFNSKD